MLSDKQLKVLLDFFQLSWPGYQKVRKGVKKRIGRHMHELQCADFETYFQKLKKSSTLQKDCIHCLSIPISRFFRDRQMWNELQYDILPMIITHNENQISAWSVGCARGEEVYSLALIWDQLKKETSTPFPEFKIFAIDVNPNFMEQAKEGRFQASSLKELPKSYIKLYFNKSSSEDIYTISADLKENIKWEVRSLFQKPPLNDFDLIFLRNSLLTYYEEPLRTKGFELIFEALRPEGWIFIGSHESIPERFLKYFKPLKRSPYAFQKVVEK